MFGQFTASRLKMFTRQNQWHYIKCAEDANSKSEVRAYWHIA